MQMEHLVKRTIETLQNGGGGVVGNNEFVNKSTQSGELPCLNFIIGVTGLNADNHRLGDGIHLFAPLVPVFATCASLSTVWKESNNR